VLALYHLSRTKAAQKAMLVICVRDNVLLSGLFLCWWYLGSTDTSLLTETLLTPPLYRSPGASYEK
jgi:NADH:ubiquinone oxidoreductase subunit 5 (subunit L)/multisubunit Na+/H+ antiporter MnhA subunit